MVSKNITFTKSYIIEDGTEELYYTITDYLGSILMLTDKYGNVEEETNYDAWGRVRNPDTWTYTGALPLNKFYRGYTGHEMLPEFALINMNGRMYDPVVGRMLSPDNYIQDPSNPQCYNRYSYCLNNPLVYVDPDGEFIFTLATILTGQWYLLPYAITADFGGMMNLAMNAQNIENFGQGLAYYGIGAVAGAVGAGVGAGVNAALAGSSFWAGVTGAANVIGTGFFSGAVTGAAGGFSTGFILGFGNTGMEGGNIGDMLNAGLEQGLNSGAMGATVGGIMGGIDAVNNNKDFWTGAYDENYVLYYDVNGNVVTKNALDQLSGASNTGNANTINLTTDPNVTQITNPDGTITTIINKPGYFRSNGLQLDNGNSITIGNSVTTRGTYSFTTLSRPTSARLFGDKNVNMPISRIGDLFSGRLFIPFWR
jgi:RHS repeat-associated protein